MNLKILAHKKSKTATALGWRRERVKQMAMHTQIRVSWRGADVGSE
jgi:hypothetical protein